MFSFFPEGGTVLNKDDGFTVDILIDTAGQEIISAKFAVLFDPEMLQVEKAERNNSLFAQFPEDDSTIDNSTGVVMLSGFTQSGTGTLYSSTGEPDIFARLTFEILKEGDAKLDWEYHGGVEILDTAMFRDASPPQNILLSKPSSVVFTIGDVIYGDVPDTGISLDGYILVTGVVLVLFGGFMIFTRPGNLRKKTGTVIVYNE